MNKQDKDLEREVGPMKYDMLELFNIMEVRYCRIGPMKYARALEHHGVERS